MIRVYPHLWKHPFGSMILILIVGHVQAASSRSKGNIDLFWVVGSVDGCWSVAIGSSCSGPLAFPTGIKCGGTDFGSPVHDWKMLLCLGSRCFCSNSGIGGIGMQVWGFHMIPWNCRMILLSLLSHFYWMGPPQICERWFINHHNPQ